MKMKTYILCAVLMATTATWAQVVNSDTIKQKDIRTVATTSQSSQADKSKNLRSITDNKTNGNWSKIKDLFM
jgi:glucose dehydrogenase